MICTVCIISTRRSGTTLRGNRARATAGAVRPLQLIYAYAALHSMYAGGSGQPDEHLVSRILLKDYTAGAPCVRERERVSERERVRERVGVPGYVRFGVRVCARVCVCACCALRMATPRMRPLRGSARTHAHALARLCAESKSSLVCDIGRGPPRPMDPIMRASHAKHPPGACAP